MDTSVLIGKPGQVNNPFSGKSDLPPTPWLASVLNPGRKPFSSHGFLTRNFEGAEVRPRLGPVVLDVLSFPLASSEDSD